MLCNWRVLLKKIMGGRRYAKWRRIVQQQRGKLYIMRICISMLLNWHKYS
ncbi:hypothetical protein AAZV13_13G176900 [Glycine max]